MSFIISVYKKDKRFKSGERFVSKYRFADCRDKAAVERELAELSQALYPRTEYRFDIIENT